MRPRIASTCYSGALIAYERSCINIEPLLLAVRSAASVVTPPGSGSHSTSPRYFPLPREPHASISLKDQRSNRSGTTRPLSGGQATTRGPDEHFGLVHYGTDPEHLNQTAKCHIRLNQTHPYTVFRVRLEGIKPETTYYYTVDSMAATGELDGVKSTVYHFSARE